MPRLDLDEATDSMPLYPNSCKVHHGAKMLTAINLSRAADPAGVIVMTFRVYVRWPSQQVTDKTSTESRAVAEVAYAELVKNAETFKTRGALGISLTESGRQLDYEELNEEADGPPGRKAR